LSFIVAWLCVHGVEGEKEGGEEEERGGKKRERKEEGGEGGRGKGEEQTPLHLSGAGVTIRRLLDLGPVPMNSS